MEDNKSYFTNQSNQSIKTTYIRKNRKKSSDIKSLKYRNNDIFDIYQKNNVPESLIKGGEIKIDNKKLFPNTKRVIDTAYQEEPKPQKRVYNPIGAWDSILSRTSGEETICGKSKKISNSKTFQSNVFPNENDNPTQIKHYKESEYSDHLHKTQITTLPGGIKRGKYDIKDDANFNLRNTESYLYKMSHDYNSNINFNGIESSEKENYNIFPTLQRFQGSYQRGVKNNDIFNNYSTEDENGKISHKKLFSDNNTFKSQIEFV